MIALAKVVFCFLLLTVLVGIGNAVLKVGRELERLVKLLKQRMK